MAEPEIKANLKKCTKEELIWLLEFMDERKYRSLDYALIALNEMRRDLKLKEADNWATISKDCMEKYLELAEKAKGCRFDSVLQAEMYELLCDVDNADRQYERCIREAYSYGLQ